MRPILSFLILVSLLTACSSKRNFTSRKYTSGRYVSNAAHKQKVSKHTRDLEEKVASVSLDTKNEKVESVLPVKDKVIAVKEFTQIQNETVGLRMVKKNKSFFDKTLSARTFNTKNERRTAKLFEDETTKTSTKSIASVFLSGAAVLGAIAAFIVAVYTLEFFFLIISAVALALAITGLVMGIQGMEEFRKEKNNGNKHVPSLVLGIIGTVLGGIGIGLSLYFAFFGSIVVSW